MKGTQLPVASNNATTGHTLQGSSMDSIFVNNWVYEKKWAYVVLSRVRTHKGLYLRHPLSMDLRNYAVPPKLAAFESTSTTTTTITGGSILLGRLPETKTSEELSPFQRGLLRGQS
jgi:hypothetical protein